MKITAIFEMLKHEMFEGIRVRICDFILWDCDWCPAFISNRCQEPCNDRNDKEAEQLDYDRFKEVKKVAKKVAMSDDMNDEDNTPDDAPKDAQSDAPRGWIKLKVLEKAIYINVSKIVALTNSSDGAVTKVHTVGAEEDPWMVDESIDEVIEKIGKA